MKAHYRTRSGRITFEVEGQTPKDLFRGIAEIEEVFEADATCGCCEYSGIVFRVRTVEDNEFYELFCESCTATLSFGQRRTGGKLFVKRKDGNGAFLPNRGWKVWRGGTSDRVEQSSEAHDRV